MNIQRKLPQPQLTFPIRGMPGVIEASDAWGANCGPNAIAGALGLHLEVIKPAVAPDGTFKGYMGVADFKQAIPRAGGRIVREWRRPDKRELLKTDGSPVIVLIRFCGPWDEITNQKARAKVQAKYRHAFCYRHGYVDELEKFGQAEHGAGWVYDCNNLVRLDEQTTVATWLPLHLWREHVLKDLTPENGNGQTEIDWMAQVELVEIPKRPRG